MGRWKDRKDIEEIRRITARDYQEVPDELIEKEEELEKVKRKIERAKREGRDTTVIENLIENKRDIQRQMEELRRIHHL